jgi:hypothetical protein
MAVHECKNPFPKLIQEMFYESFQYNGPLSEIHQLLDSPLLTTEQKEYHRQLHGWSTDRDSIFVKKFHEYVDKHASFNEAYYSFLRSYVLPHFPEETKIVIQKTPNIRFSLPNTAAIGCDPNDPAEIVGLHHDRQFGHHILEQNFIIPITRMYESNSIYYEPYANSNISPHQYESLTLNENEYAHAYFNEIMHCNRINRTEQTRISFDIRVMPYTKYMENLDDFKNTKFELGKYYIVL